MKTVQEIEEAVSQLSPEQIASFRKWFDEFCEELWGRQIEQDAMSGKLEEIALEYQESGGREAKAFSY